MTTADFIEAIAGPYGTSAKPPAAVKDVPAAYVDQEERFRIYATSTKADSQHGLNRLLWATISFAVKLVAVLCFQRVHLPAQPGTASKGDPQEPAAKLWFQGRPNFG